MNNLNSVLIEGALEKDCSADFTENVLQFTVESIRITKTLLKSNFIPVEYPKATEKMRDRLTKHTKVRVLGRLESRAKSGMIIVAEHIEIAPGQGGLNHETND